MVKIQRPVWEETIPVSDFGWLEKFRVSSLGGATAKLDESCGAETGYAAMYGAKSGKRVQSRTYWNADRRWRDSSEAPGEEAPA